MLKIALAKLPDLCALMQKEAELLVPAKNKAGKVDYKVYAEGVDICLNEKTSRSAKDAFFPQVENLLKFKAEGKNLSLEQVFPPDHATILFGVKACDARSFKLLDKVFLTNPVDSYYKARRENCLVIGLGIPRSPSIDAIRADSSPQTNAPAPSLICKTNEKSVPIMFLPK